MKDGKDGKKPPGCSGLVLGLDVHQAVRLSDADTGALIGWIRILGAQDRRAKVIFDFPDGVRILREKLALQEEAEYGPPPPYGTAPATEPQLE